MGNGGSGGVRMIGTTPTTAGSGLLSSREFVLSELDKFDEKAPITQARTPPASWYNTGEFFGLEKQTLFRNNWQYAARAGSVGAEAGSYLHGVFLDQPYVIVRGHDGRVRAFHNVCSHHGAALIRPEEPETGVAQQFVCCYHGWTFNLSGQLTKATRVKGIENFRNRDWGLQEIPVAQWGPFLFLWFGQGQPSHSLHGDLQPVSEWLTKFGYPADVGEGMVYHSSRTYELACNWKIINENYLDGEYHIPYLHPGLNSSLDMGSYSLETYDRLSFQLAAPTADEVVESEEKLGANFADRYGSGAVYAVYYPTFAINRFGNVLESNYLLPRSEHSTTLVYDFFFDHRVISDHEYTTRAIKASHQVQTEDSGICELLHRNMKSAGFRSGRYAPGPEKVTHHFHTCLARDLKSPFR
ncbi:MAG: aromatic ring-hydroxylating dioxygenase subunit alpha [archaeon]|nr:aromatic ring-hydroxylating dioxygenase subunit alpha [archaeon]